MMKKIAVLTAILIAAYIALPVGFGLWSENIGVRGNISFAASPSPSPEEVSPDVGETAAGDESENAEDTGGAAQEDPDGEWLKPEQADGQAGGGDAVDVEDTALPESTGTADGEAPKTDEELTEKDSEEQPDGTENDGGGNAEEEPAAPAAEAAVGESLADSG